MNTVQNKRLERNTIRRKCNRLSTFDNTRNLAECEVPDPMSETQKDVECKRMRLQKWKEGKERRKKEAAALKKKPFIAGIVHHPLKYVPPPPPRPMRTKSQTQNSKGSKSNKPLHSFAPSNASFKPDLKNVKKLPTLTSVHIKKKKIDITFDPVEPDFSQKKASLNLDKSNGSTKSESEEYPKTSIEEKTSTDILPKSKNKSSSTEEQQIVEVQKISPCVTLSPSKKMEGGLLNDVYMERVAYFRGQLDSEVKRITQMCETWDRISQQVLLSESALEMVLCAVGQARLLVSQKLAQFGSLVAACERPDPTTGLVTPTDLEGVWDVINIQVKNVNLNFKKLEELQARNWIEETPVIQKKRAPKRAKHNSKPTATSCLRDLIAAARIAKKNEDPPTVPREDDHTTTTQEDPTNSTTKKFEAGFFYVRSPITPFARSTPSNKSSLLKTVLSKKAKRAASVSKDSTSLAMLRASKIGRSLKKDDTALEAIEKSQVPLIQINLMATPGRSILKSINVASTQTKGKKSVKIALFNDSDGENSFSQSPEAIEKVAEGNVDSGFSSMDVEKETDQNKENVKQKLKLVRQNAIEDRSPVLTRSRRKSET